MDQFLFQDMPEDKRAGHLESLAEGMEERDYTVFLTQDELAMRKSQFTTLAIQEAKLNDKKAEYLADMKAELKPIVTEKSTLLNEIKSGSIQEVGICYKMIDRETKQVGYYNKRGQLVEQRPMTFDDRQFNLKLASNQ